MIVFGESIVLDWALGGWRLRRKPYAERDRGDDMVQVFVGEGAESRNEARVRERLNLKSVGAGFFSEPVPGCRWYANKPGERRIRWLPIGYRHNDAQR